MTLLQRLLGGPALWRQGAAFRTRPRHAPLPPCRQLLVTGSRGAVAQLLLPQLQPMLAALGVGLRCVDRLAPGDERADLGNYGDCMRALQGVDAVLHLAAASKEASPYALVADNTVALANLLNAAHEAGVTRFVFASSMHVMGMYGRLEPFSEASPPKPDSYYAASKLHGEALCQLYAQKHDAAVTCLRLGHVAPTLAQAEPGSWIGPQDVAAMVRIALRMAHAGFEVFHAVARYDGSPLPPSRAAHFGYVCAQPGGPYAEALATVARYWGHDDASRLHRGAVFAAEPFHRPPTER